MATVETTHSGNLNRTKVQANPNAGATQPAGKSSEPDANLKIASRLKPEAVRTVDRNANKGVAPKIAQENENGNPKHRTKNFSGAPVKSGTGEDN